MLEQMLSIQAEVNQAINAILTDSSVQSLLFNQSVGM